MYLYGAKNQGHDAPLIGHDVLVNLQQNLHCVNPFMGTLKLQSNKLLYSNTEIGTLAVDGWTVIFVTARRGLGNPTLHVT